MDRNQLVPKQTQFDFEKAGKQLVAIDHETAYDIPFKLSALAESIRTNKEFCIVDAVVCLSIRERERGGSKVWTYSYGSSDANTTLGILERAKWNLKP